MRELLINYAKDKVFNSFKFLEQLGYVAEKYGISNDGRFEISFTNSVTKKDIHFIISDNEDINRFHMTISIIKKPYLEVNDFIDFDVYLQKNGIAFERSLEGNEINEVAIGRYINNYFELFKTHGINLITSGKQFSHYFPEWT